MEVFRRVLKPTTAMTVIVTYRADGRLSLTGTGRHGSGQVYGYLTIAAIMLRGLLLICL